ncbi:MAG: FtsW/RodA/SpoVE family cell cycle protein [Clostridia bacterium]|nr:FtsW/RodA/SpoVE family cell cycle protein [Clostridia bacterium]
MSNNHDRRSSLAGVVILLITAFIIFRVFKIALSCGSTTGRYICVGVASMFMIQVIENVGMCLGIMPVIGITYPFLSYGGSSILSCFLAVGMVLSVSTHKDDSIFK